jgi:hypothetical protein
MIETQWYYARDDQPMGPVSGAELRQLAEAGELQPDDLLWREGMEEWTTAINLGGLFGKSADSKSEVASAVVQPGAEDRSLRPQPALPPAPHTRLHSLLRTTQTILWTTCVLVVLFGLVLFTRAFLQAEDTGEEAAAATVFATFFIAAYVLAQCGDKLSRLLLANARRRRR